MAKTEKCCSNRQSSICSDTFFKSWRCLPRLVPIGLYPPKECLLSVEGGIPFTHGRHSFEAKKAARGPLPVIFMPSFRNLHASELPSPFFHSSVLSHKNYFYFSLNDENPLMFRFFFLSLQDETIKNCIFQFNIWIGRA